MKKTKNNQIPNSRFQIHVFGFTLVELLVVIAILGILVTIGLTSFRSSQARGRDTQRKSDLKQIASALELYYSDYGKYPDAAGGVILACPSSSSAPCTWGASGKEFTDSKTLYMKLVPKDPVSDQAYFYRTVAVDLVPNMGFQLFSHLENTQDPALISTGYSCGTANCNFAVTSSNTTPSE